jgi:hypothetical protein
VPVDNGGACSPPSVRSEPGGEPGSAVAQPGGGAVPATAAEFERDGAPGGHAHPPDADAPSDAGAGAPRSEDGQTGARAGRAASTASSTSGLSDLELLAEQEDGQTGELADPAASAGGPRSSQLRASALAPCA